MGTKTPVRTTERLILRPFTEEDADAFHQILSGEGVLQYFPRTDPPPLDQVRQWISKVLTHWEERGYGLWAVQPRPGGELMGRCGLQYVPDTSEIEVDFLLGKAFWGQGFATEAARTSLRYGFDELGLDSIVGIVHPENAASRRVLEKIGMRVTERKQYFGMDCYRYCLERPDYYGVT